MNGDMLIVVLVVIAVLIAFGIWKTGRHDGRRWVPDALPHDGLSGILYVLGAVVVIVVILRLAGLV